MCPRRSYVRLVCLCVYFEATVHDTIWRFWGFGLSDEIYFSLNFLCARLCCMRACECAFKYVEENNTYNCMHFFDTFGVSCIFMY